MMYIPSYSSIFGGYNTYSHEELCFFVPNTFTLLLFTYELGSCPSNCQPSLSGLTLSYTTLTLSFIGLNNFVEVFPCLSLSLSLCVNLSLFKVFKKPGMLGHVPKHCCSACVHLPHKLHYDL